MKKKIDENHREKQRQQALEIKERLHRIRNKILGMVENMSGLACPHCGKIIDVFKTNGGRVTAERENLNLLGSLPLEPEVVQSSDMGHTAVLENDQRPYTRAFDRMVDTIDHLLTDNEKPVQETVAG